MQLTINRYAYPISTLGPGNRIVIWVQGCSKMCPGCASVDTWDYDGGTKVNVKDFALKIFNIIKEYNLDGLTLTGGEPSEQADALVGFLKLLKNYLKDVYVKFNFNVLMFSGNTYKFLKKDKQSLLEQIDVAVCGPYDKKRKRTNILVASDNQEFVVLNNKFNKQYNDYILNNKASLQFEVDSGGITFAGITNPGDLSLIESKLAEKGVILGGTSWNS